MKKVLLILIAGVALVVWVATWFRTPDAVATSGAREWPGGMGTLDSIAKRLTPRQPNEASKKLLELGDALPQNDTVDNYVWAEVSRGELTIGEPPALPDVSAIRELLLREPIVWEREGGGIEVGDARTQTRRVVQMTTARALTASALAKARANDAAAWDDLHAVWKLARSLDGQPHVMEQTAVLSMARMVNAVAWKMPLPAPAWFGELQSYDLVAPLLQAFQYQTAAYWEDGKVFPTKWHANSAEHDRQIAVKLFAETRCDVNAAVNTQGSDLSSFWRRAFRYRAEREATANALRAREGNAIETKSRCTDGAWTFDGTTLRFNRDIALPVPDKPMPLLLRVKP